MTSTPITGEAQLLWEALLPSVGSVGLPEGSPPWCGVVDPVSDEGTLLSDYNLLQIHPRHIVGAGEKH